LETLLREIEEEVGISPSDIEKVELIGYINDDTNDVGKVHLGLAYVVDLKTDDVKIDKGELASGKFVTSQEAKEILKNPDIDVEPWSRIVLDVILDE
jgi:predicted NUDIX family phosphoesterase